MRALVTANAVYLAVLLLHTEDHALRQHRPLPAELTYVGLSGLVAGVLALALAIRRHPAGPLLCVVVGLSAVAGFAAIHLAPHWGVLSDPYADHDLDAVSWASMLAVMLAGATLAAAGLRERRIGGPLLSRVGS